jgi:hypothetical protein
MCSRSPEKKCESIKNSSDVQRTAQNSLHNKKKKKNKENKAVLHMKKYYILVPGGAFLSFRLC